MVQLGWMQDSHCKPNGTGVSATQFAEDYDHLIETKGASDMFYTGDMVHPDNGTGVPHVPSEVYDNFWNNIHAGVTNPDALKAYVPGNHEVPVQGFLNSHEKTTLRAKFEYPTDGVTVFCINTQASGTVTGSPGADSWGGTGVVAPRVSYRDLKWLDQELANAGTDAKLILPHAPTYLTYGGVLGSGVTGSNPGVRAMRNNDVYWICQNYQQLHEMFQKHSKVVVPYSHLYQNNERGSKNYDGVRYAWKHHYYDGGTQAADTFGHIDIDSTGVTLSSINSSDKTENVLLDATF